MILSDLKTAVDLANQLAELDAKLAKASQAQVFVSGTPVEPLLLEQLMAAGIPIVEQFFAAQRASIVAQLNALGITES